MSRTRWRSIVLALFLLTAFRSEAMDKTMRIALVRSPQELNPFTYLSLPEWYIHFNITATLVTLDQDNQIVSGLANKWSIEDGGKTYKFTLDKSRKWSDGSSITPDQVLTSMSSQARHKNATLLQKLLKQGPVEEALYLEDGAALVMRLEAPVQNFLYNLARPEYGVIDADSLSKTKVLTAKIKTSGNYKIESITENALVLVPNRFSSQVQAENPQHIEFAVIKDTAEIIKRLKQGNLDFYEAQSDDVLATATESGLYQVVDGGLDNLATMQARKLKPEQRRAVQVLGEFLDKNVLSPAPKKAASRPVAYSVVPMSSQESARISIAEAKKRLGGKIVTLKLELGEEATKNQLYDAEIIQSEAKKIGITIEIVKGIKDFRRRWEMEDYGLTLMRMGVNADDEVELLYGYFCTGFKPYQSLQPLVCDSLNTAAKPGTGSESINASLLKVYRDIRESGKIVPLYHFPRRFLIPKRWTLKNYNNLLPFPIFTSFHA